MTGHFGDGLPVQAVSEVCLDFLDDLLPETLWRLACPLYIVYTQKRRSVILLVARAGTE